MDAEVRQKQPAIANPLPGNTDDQDKTDFTLFGSPVILVPLRKIHGKIRVPAQKKWRNVSITPVHLMLNLSGWSFC
jgi:hypothetical protein